MDDTGQVNRRSFLGLVTWAIGGLISAVMGIPAIAYIIGPALERAGSQEWIQLGGAPKVELGTPTLFKTTLERQTGWITDQEKLSIYVLTDNGRDYIAMSNICTHLGCRVRWIADRRQFYCPCHDAVFDRQGNVVSGPPPRPLDRYTVKVENDQVFILAE